MLQRLRSVAQASEAGTGATGSPGWESLRDQFSAAAESRLQSWAGVEGEEMSILQVSSNVKPFTDGPLKCVSIQLDNSTRGVVLPKHKMLRGPLWNAQQPPHNCKAPQLQPAPGALSV